MGIGKQWFEETPAGPAYDAARVATYAPGTSQWLQHRARMAGACSGGTRLDGELYAHEISERLSVELSHASSAIGGNRYSELDTEILVKYGKPAARKPRREARDVLNHKAAVLNIASGIATMGIDIETMSAINSFLAQDALPRLPPTDIAARREGLAELCRKVSDCGDPFEASFALLAGIGYLRPFAASNGRTARVVSAIPLLKAGLPPVTFAGIDRPRYVSAMRSWIETGDTTMLSTVVSVSYARSAPAYAVTEAVRRKVHAVDIRVRDRFSTAISDHMRERISGSGDTPDIFARTAFADLEGEDLEVVVANFTAVMTRMDDIIAPAYRVDDTLLADYLAAIGNPARP